MGLKELCEFCISKHFLFKLHHFHPCWSWCGEMAGWRKCKMVKLNENFGPFYSQPWLSFLIASWKKIIFHFSPTRYLNTLIFIPIILIGATVDHYNWINVKLRLLKQCLEWPMPSWKITSNLGSNWCNWG